MNGGRIKKTTVAVKGKKQTRQNIESQFNAAKRSASVKPPQPKGADPKNAIMYIGPDKPKAPQPVANLFSLTKPNNDIFKILGSSTTAKTTTQTLSPPASVQQQESSGVMNVLGKIGTFLYAISPLGWGGCKTYEPKKPIATPTPVPAPTADPNFKPGMNPIKNFVMDYGQLEKNKSVIDTALQSVANTQPSRSNFFNWTGDKNKFKNTEFAIAVLTTKEIPDQIKPAIPKDDEGDAFTVGLGTKNEQKIYVVLLADRLFYDKSGKERPDGFARTMIALGHEIYGNVQTMASKIDNGTFDRPEDRRSMEIKAFTAGVEYIERMMASEQFQKLSPKMQNEFREALVREKAGLASWQNAR